MEKKEKLELFHNLFYFFFALTWNNANMRTERRFWRHFVSALSVTKFPASRYLDIIVKTFMTFSPVNLASVRKVFSKIHFYVRRRLSKYFVTSSDRKLQFTLNWNISLQLSTTSWRTSEEESLAQDIKLITWKLAMKICQIEILFWSR